jgi:hypothetical protein
MSKQYAAHGTASDRYYVSVNDKGERQLTTLAHSDPISYPLPDFPPGLNQQLDEWRRWRDMLDQAMRITDSEGVRAAYADALGVALRHDNQDEPAGHDGD